MKTPNTSLFPARPYHPILVALIAALLLQGGFAPNPRMAFAASDAPPADLVPFAGLTPQEACDKATLPPGFKMHVFASEPELAQPIAFCLDHRGRVWVAEGRTYPRRQGDPPADERPPGPARTQPSAEQLRDIFGGADRILILEDTDGDHRADKRTVFLENVNLISGLQVGLGGVWIGAAPYLLFVPVENWADPRPAGDLRILLDGWDYKADTHETLNTFTWGPDGWLYGTHGVFCPSFVGRPGAPDEERQWMDAGVWRYHPTRHVFEVFTEGGSNPWGIDFDEYGQCWAEMCVIPHLFHMIQGARIQRQGGEHFTLNHDETQRYRRPGQLKTVHPHIYRDIQQHGDHVHWAGQFGPHAANARSDAAGGGHAHAGVLCYLGESWPEEYRGALLIGNIHGQRLNLDLPERQGSGFVGRHGPDFLNFNDTWSQTLNQLCDPNGSVFIIDWYDANQCHHGRDDGHDRSNGRVYKIVYRDEKVSPVNVAGLTEEELVRLVPSKNEFLSRHARQVLQERAARGAVAPSTLTELRAALRGAPDTPARLRALWALHLTGGFNASTAIENMQSKDEWVRAWTIQLALESHENLDRLIRESKDQGLEADPDLYDLAESDPSPLVRLFLASAAVRVRGEEARAGLVERLLKRDEDAKDHNLPLMIWFAMEPLAADHPKEALTAALGTSLPGILHFTARRVASIGSREGLDLVAEALDTAKDADRQLDILTGLRDALGGQRAVAAPTGWSEIETALGQISNSDIRILTQTLSLTFGSPNALSSLRATLEDPGASIPVRRAALDALRGAKDPQLPKTLRKLIQESDLSGPALRALAAYDDDQTPSTILRAYAHFDPGQKRDALATLVSRPAYAQALLASVASNQVPRSDLTAELVRQLRRFEDAEIRRQLEAIYGATREISADKQAEIERYRNVYRRGGSQPGNAYAGRVVFNKVCAQCHMLFDSGGQVGPDITGANRSDLNYLLETIVDPNAVIPNEYRSNEIETKDGRVLTGLVKQVDDTRVVFQTANELVTLPRNEIESMQQSQLSMMPEGLLEPLTENEVRDLLYYLSRPGQVPLQAAEATP